MNLKIFAMIGAILAGLVYAEDYRSVVKKSAGTYVETFDYAVDADDSQLISSQGGIKVVDLTCRNNDSTYEVFIGSNMAGADLRSYGFPLKAQESIEIGGFSGDLYGIAESGQTVEVRCWEGKIR